MKLLSLICRFLRLGIIFEIPGGIAADNVGMWGFYGLVNNLNNYTENLSSIATSGTTITLIATTQLSNGTPGNILSGFTQLNAGATGTLIATLPKTNSILGALGATTPLDGNYSEPIHIINNSGVTVSLAAGDANTKIMGSTSTVAGNVRKLLLRVLNSSNISITNVGTWTL